MKPATGSTTSRQTARHCVGHFWMFSTARDQCARRAASLPVTRYLTLGHPADLLITTLARAVLREDADFHSYQMLEASVRQHREWAGGDEGRHILIAVARLPCRPFTDRAGPAADGYGRPPPQPESGIARGSRGRLSRRRRHPTQTLPHQRPIKGEGWGAGDSYNFSSRLALPFNSFSLSSAQSGRVSVHLVPGGLSTNG